MAQPTPCSFSAITNACGCLTGYNVPLLADDNSPIDYPVHVIGVGGADLGIANSPSEYIALWNADAPSHAKGNLSVGNSSVCFNLSYLVGVAPISKVVGSVDTPPPPTMVVVRVGNSGLDTTGAPHTEAEYLAAEATAVAGSSTQSVADSVVTINATVLQFGNVGDKVDFVQVPNTIGAFTKWSVLGDALQQNQPIDASFNLASGNVWFMSVVGSDRVYQTYSQTTFGNTVIFSN